MIFPYQQLKSKLVATRIGLILNSKLFWVFLSLIPWYYIVVSVFSVLVTSDFHRIYLVASLLCNNVVLSTIFCFRWNDSFKYCSLIAYDSKNQILLSQKLLLSAYKILYCIDCIFLITLFLNFQFNLLITLITLTFVDTWLIFKWKIVSQSHKHKSNNFLRTYKPELLFFFSGRSDTVYQLLQWTDVIAKLNRDFKTCIILWEEHFDSKINRYDIPTVRITKIEVLSDFIGQNSVRAVFYTNNYPNNFLVFSSIRKLCHIYLNHGDSDKYENVMKTAKDYDFLFVAGEASLDRHLKAGWDRDKLKTIGRPQLTSLKENIALQTDNTDKIKVLYAPTWEGNKRIDGYSSVSSLGIKIVKDILSASNFCLIVKPHPLTGLYVDTYRQVLGKMKKIILDQKQNGHRWHNTSSSPEKLFELFVQCDFLISDISSVAIDFLILNKPIIATNHFGINPEEYHDIFPFWQCSYMLDKNTDICRLIKSIQQNDYLENKRKEMATYYLGENADSYSDTIKHFIKQVKIAIDDKERSFRSPKHIPWELFK